LPFTPDAQKKVAAYRALVTPTGDTPGGYCLGTGMPGSMIGSGGYPMEIHQRPEQIIIVYEAHSEIRRVYLGNRIVPDADRIPGRNGHSSGRWEGETLVVETTNFNEKTQWGGSTGALRVVERFTRTDANTISYRFTVTDPDTWVSPWTAEIPFEATDQRMFEYACHEGNYALANILRGARFEERER
jgi:hypothetical protein